jgi:hypothetical protein
MQQWVLFTTDNICVLWEEKRKKEKKDKKEKKIDSD